MTNILTERQSDERLLKMLGLRTDGISPAKIGRIIGMSAQFVSTATLRARRDDEKQSGEPARSVARGYW